MTATAIDASQLPDDFIRIRPDWVAGYSEPALEPDLPIIDPHHHLWVHAGVPYLLPELLADTNTGHRIIATVFVECRAMYRARGTLETRSLGETEFANGIAAMSASGLFGATRACAAIVGNVDLRLGARARDALQAHVAISGGRFRGIRNVSAWHASGIRATSANPPEGLLLDPEFRKGFACLAPLGLSFDSWLVHTQLDDFLDLARAFPDTTLVLDHVGGPLGIGLYRGRRDEVFTEWRSRIQAVAQCPNVHVKLGGLGMHTPGFDFHLKNQPPSSEELAQAWRPYIETCIDAFGADRAMFESNFPVDKGTCGYGVLWNAFKRIAAGCSDTEKQALFCGTAAKVYRIETADMANP
jgi:predicted TIM-barrel fold metal-dependent hydrolase